MRSRNEMMPPADAGPVERPVRPFAGMRKGWRVKGDKKMPDSRLRYHWVHTPHGWMHWCGCAPGFRVGGGYYHPRTNKGRKAYPRIKA